MDKVPGRIDIYMARYSIANIYKVVEYEGDY